MKDKLTIKLTASDALLILKSLQMVELTKQTELLEMVIIEFLTKNWFRIQEKVVKGAKEIRLTFKLSEATAVFYTINKYETQPYIGVMQKLYSFMINSISRIENMQRTSLSQAKRKMILERERKEIFGF